MNHEDRVKLALLASYKNRDYFRRFAAPFETWFTKEELKQIRDFGALLKFVYALNVSKRNIVSKITVELIDDIIHVVVTTSERAIAEAYQVERQKKHIERVFKRSVIIHFNEEGWK